MTSANHSDASPDKPEADALSDDRLWAGFAKARRTLLAERDDAGYWIGELASSAVSTATAVSALSLVDKHLRDARWATEDEIPSEVLQRLTTRAASWLIDQQNDDGGWGDTDRSHSNIATTMLAVAALHLAKADVKHASNIARANAYIDKKGRLEGLRARYGRDKTFAIPILTNAALAGQADWKDIDPLPFELACVPQRFYRFLQLPVVSYAIPALVAVGQARFHHQRPWNPLSRCIRSLAAAPSLNVLLRMQPSSGGFLEATPLTSFVVMSLASIGQVDHPVVRRSVRFLINSAREDGSWPIDTNLATFNTTLSLNALAECDGDSGSVLPEEDLEACLAWVLSCQHRQRHPFTGADPGGWGWTDLSGAVPDADDTPGALLALANWRERLPPARIPPAIDAAAADGLRWLLDLQNRDGGWPTFCRGWGRLPFDRSGADLTAHALRALRVWRDRLGDLPKPQSGDHLTGWELERAVARGFAYLEKTQAPTGEWYPLWFGNQDHPEEANPVYGTARVLLAYRDWKHGDSAAASRGYQWLTHHHNPDGGWGGGPSLGGGLADSPARSSVEESALAVEALLGAPGVAAQAAAWQGVEWLVERVEQGTHTQCWPIGFYFAKLWYHERLYPHVFTVAALGRAARSRDLPARPQSAPLD